MTGVYSEFRSLAGMIMHISKYRNQMNVGLGLYIILANLQSLAYVYNRETASAEIECISS